ncbi:MAG: LLM class flavin-dependent oxidoreductase [bacterium]|nr:LLM class flavin-dependent oxidoreductase [Deltaproteobacteria bacterium]MCP4906995.1 LLM class flavin-dependent oxidoreductase [bacterium]
MILDVFSELQSAEAGGHGFEEQLFRDAIEQAKLADAVGFGIWWAVEHHGYPPFSYSSAPEMMLTAISQHTERLRLGHAGVLGPFAINHPMRIAERGAFLDNLSGGRLELGIARSVPNEWETFGSDPDETRAEVNEALRMIPQMWAQDVFKWKSERITIPPLQIVPKPLQRPHPPLWVAAATPEGFEGAGRLGVGVLATVMLQPVEQLGVLFDAYRRGQENSDPVGEFVNDQRAAFAFFHCAETRQQAIDSRASEAALWFMNAQPRLFSVPRDMWIETVRDRTPLWGNAENRVVADEDQSGGDLEDPHPIVRLMNRQWAGLEIDPVEAYEALEPIDSVVIGDAETCLRKLDRYGEAGVDRLMCLMQMGHISQESILSCIRTAGELVIPKLR